MLLSATTAQFAPAQSTFNSMADIKQTPPISIPEAAVKSGISGEVRVSVKVDREGNVASVAGAYGPGSVCQQVTRADVIALREAARDAAKNAKFEPARKDGRFAEVGWVRFDIPVRSADDDEKVLRFSAAGGNGADGYGFLKTNGISLPKPPYPAAARALRATGGVSIELLIDENGDVFSAAPVSGHPLLRFAARDAACEAKFKPTLLGGKPVKIAGVITYSFRP